MAFARFIVGTETIFLTAESFQYASECLLSLSAGEVSKHFYTPTSSPYSLLSPKSDSLHWKLPEELEAHSRRLSGSTATTDADEVKDRYYVPLEPLVVEALLCVLDNYQGAWLTECLISHAGTFCQPMS